MTINKTPPINKVSPREFQLSNWQGHGDFARYSIKSQFRLDNSEIHISFEVEKQAEDNWYQEQSYSQEYYKNWGLWQTDVVEFFLQARDEEHQSQLPYIEFLMSPNNHKFALMTLVPRKIAYTPRDIEFSGSTSVSDNKWKSEFIIQNPFEHSQMLWGNFHACLGHKDERQYYSAFHLENPIPDFHRPEQFQLLGEL